MYIFHLAKGQENLNSRSKMAHLPLSGIGLYCHSYHTIIFVIKHAFLPSLVSKI